MVERKNRSILNMRRSMLKIKKINSTTFKSLVRSLRYLTCTRPDILYGVRLVSWFMETLTMTHIKASKQILWYIKGTIDFSLFNGYSNNFVLVGYSDSDWVGDTNDRKSIVSFVFYIGDTIFTWSSKKQSIVTLFFCFFNLFFLILIFLKFQRKLSFFNIRYVSYSLSLQFDIMQNIWKNMQGTHKYF